MCVAFYAESDEQSIKFLPFHHFLRPCGSSEAWYRMVNAIEMREVLLAQEMHDP